MYRSTFVAAVAMACLAFVLAEQCDKKFECPEPQECCWYVTKEWLCCEPGFECNYHIGCIAPSSGSLLAPLATVVSVLGASAVALVARLWA
eukprot:TRINITY_DN26817_c0_g1_i1.p2 TRINITY_DN26817_c0_g1~~TRINITY_DN26817_c0_g1_i1.p2  ORF type:complete len:103 (+),score=11.38 TRINITY_DN26817_c0_g1_i1:38-310(+)